MPEHIELLQSALESVPYIDKVTAETIPIFLTQQTASRLLDLTTDFEKHKLSLSTCSKAVLARSAFEASVQILGALYSIETAYSIYHSVILNDIKRMKQLNAIEDEESEIFNFSHQALTDHLQQIENSFDYSPKKYSVYTLACLVGAKEHYRTLYYELSRYVHHNPLTLSQAEEPSLVATIDSLITISNCAAADMIVKRFIHHKKQNICERIDLIFEAADEKLRE